MGDLLTIAEGISARYDRISAGIDRIYETLLELSDRMKARDSSPPAPPIHNPDVPVPVLGQRHHRLLPHQRRPVCYTSIHIFPAGSIANANSFTSTDNCGYTDNFPTASTISAIPTCDYSSGHICASHGEGQAPGDCMSSVDVRSTDAGVLPGPGHFSSKACSTWALATLGRPLTLGVLLGLGHFSGKACDTRSPHNTISSEAIRTGRTKAVGQG
jgi:hypothetical protein